MNAFRDPLTEYSEFIKLTDSIRSDKLPVRVSGCTDSMKSHLIWAAGSERKNRLIITSDPQKAKELYDDLKLYDKNVFLYPSKDIIFYNADIRGNAIVRERLKIVRRLALGQPVTVVAEMTAGMDKLLPLKRIKENSIHIDIKEQLNTDELCAKLTEIGYVRQAEVSEPGEFAVRGGIIDIYPLAEESPYRVELWGDDIDSIRIFDAESQRSIENTDAFDIFSAMEIVLSEEELARGVDALSKEAKKTADKLRASMKTEEAARVKRSAEEFKENLEYLKSAVNMDSYVDYFTAETVSFFDYFKNGESLVFLDEPIRTVDAATAVSDEFAESMKGRLEMGYCLPGQTSAVFDAKQLTAKLRSMPVVMLSTLDYRYAEIPAKQMCAFNVRSISSYNGDFEMLTGELTSWKKKGYKVILLTSSRSRAVRLAEELRDRGLTSYAAESPERELQAGEIMVISGGASRGFEYPLIRFALVCETDIFGKQKSKPKKKQYEGTKLNDLAELTVGDYVVHENYGVGIYKGIEKIEVDHVIKDYINIEYAGGGTLHVRATAMDAVQKYSGPEDSRPKLNKLNGTEWKTTKTRVRGAVKNIASELVKLYAARQSRHGFMFGPDNIWQREFEETFPYEETEDQLKAIEDTKHDMESSVIMDRLICGDVGYGKTEIAIRAAFKAAQDSKQVAILVPTTILAQQHYNTFVQRMKDYPVRVDMLSRFKTPGQQKAALAELKAGRLDIIIGTHRLLSKDVEFKNLGLLIVDEEQRFGVTHKEKIKKLKGDVDVLTLTATPIPRTLHMSLIGIRDMSVLNEPPVDRMPIQTFVLEHNDEMIREAINRELSRGGQVYYVYNKVMGIADVAANVQRLVPNANVVFAHGQMNEHELERIMFSFVNGEIDVLVSTTIIETGLDISNVNTIIIDDADRLGLSQLYQLRGRVGRSNRSAYAFLMYRRDRQLKETAEKRLAAIREFTELGSGIKIAMRDLEIRGAGNLLGAEQSGHMEAVGYDLYCKMLNEAVRAYKLGDEEVDIYDTAIDMDMDAFIPPTYIRNEFQKLEMYKRIATISNDSDKLDMQGELIDRYGEPPVSVNNLLEIALIKAKAHDVYITGVTQKGLEVTLDLYERAKLDVARLNEVLDLYPKRLRFTKGNNLVLKFTLEGPKGKVVKSISNAEVFKQMTGLIGELSKIRLM